MNMNRIAKLSAAVTLGLGLMGMGVAADAANQHAATPRVETSASPYTHGKVIRLGTIVVTRADMDGALKAKAHPSYGSMVFLGRIKVTADDTEEARAASRVARKQGTVFLGAVTVTGADTPETRYAAAQAASQPGTFFVGTVNVTSRDTKPALVGEVMAAVRRLKSNAAFSVISALVFERAGG